MGNPFERDKEAFVLPPGDYYWVGKTDDPFAIEWDYQVGKMDRFIRWFNRMVERCKK